MMFWQTFKNQRWWMILIFVAAIAFVTAGWLNWIFEEIIDSTWIMGFVIILLAWLVVITFQMFKAVQGAASLENSILAPGQMFGEKPGKQKEIEEFQEKLKETIDEIKNRKGFWGRRTALYSMPWYMFIGPPAAGKTTAVKNSGLDFVQQNEPFRGVGGTRNCDWWFSTSAIFLDTAGRYMTESDDQEEWTTFLETLRKGRRSQPVDGVVLSISIADLLSASREEIEMHAREMRKKLDELLDKLRVRFPVYLMFTKCDLLQGFVDYFGELTLKEQNQVWGCTFERNEQSTNEPRRVFESGYDELHEKIMAMRRERLSKPLKRDARRKVYLFPLQFAEARENLAFFVEKLFYFDPFKRKKKENPIWRGYYFTSGTQGEGAPLDRAIKSIEEQFGLPPVQDDVFESGQSDKKHYFIKDLLTRVVIPDRAFVTGSKTRKGKLFDWLTQGAVALGSVLLLGLFGMGVHSDREKSAAVLGDLEKAVVQVDGVLKADSTNGRSNGDKMVETFRMMDLLSTRIDSVEHFDPTMPWHMFDKDSTLFKARKLYFKTANEVVDKFIYRKLETRLANDGRLGSNREISDDVYNDLKAYLIMGSDYDSTVVGENGLLGGDYQNFIAEQFTEILEDTLVAQTDSSRRHEMIAMLGRQVDFIVENLKQPGAKNYQNKPSLVGRNRKWLNDEPLTINSVYAGIRQKGLNNSRLRGFSVNSVGGENLLTSAFVPGMFSVKGWEDFVAEEIVDASNNPEKADWVRGISAEQLPLAMRDSKEMGKRLLDLYYEEHISRWNQFLASIEYKPFNNVATASEHLAALSDAESSPIVKLLQKAAYETDFETPLSRATQRVGGFWDKIKTFVGIDSVKTTVEAHKVNRNFEDLHQFVGEEGKMGVALSTAMSHLQNLAGLIDPLHGDGGKAARDFAAAVVGQPRQNELALMERDVRGALSDLSTHRQDIRNIFEPPISLAEGAIFGDTQVYLNAQWRVRVFDVFDREISKFYPFRNTENSLGLEKFKSFFDPASGVVTQFLDEELAPFIDRNTFATRGVRLSRNTKNQLRKFRDIGGTMFAGSQLGVNFRLRAKPPETESSSGEAPRVDRYSLFIDGKEDVYEMGAPRWKAFKWPSEDASLTVRLSITLRGGEGVKKLAEYSDDWAFFRLIHSARTKAATAGNYMELYWRYATVNYVVNALYDLEARSKENPFVATYFTSFSLPRKLN